METIADQIRAGRQRMFEKGWCQGSYVDDDGSMCIRGSLLGTGSNFLRAWNFCDQVAREEYDVYTAAEFNDTPGRTFDEIVEFTDKAEKLAEMRGL